MKIIKKISLILTLTALIMAGSCKKILQENPKQNLYPNYLSTQGGIFSAITGVYSSLRGYYTNEGNALPFYSGTDEQNLGGSATTQVWATYNGMNAGATSGFFNTPYEDINTLNGALQYSATANFDTPVNQGLYIGQIKFLRAFIYMFLVQSFGGVTATNQSGISLHTTFTTAPTSADAPSKLTDIWAQIIKDFTDASTALPNTRTSTNPFTAAGVGLTPTAGTALAYLAKAYLTRGYSEAAQSTDFQQAATITQNLIANQSTYGFGLWQDYSQVNAQANDYGKENIFGFDMGNDPTYDAYTVNGSGGRGINQLPVFFRWNYISNSGDNTSASVPQKIGGANVMLRDMYNGRPYIRSRPNTPYTINYAFADQIHDSRFDNIFQTFWICNTNAAPGLQSDGVTRKGTLIPTTPVSLTSYIPPTNGDTAILFPQGPPSNTTLARRDAFKGQITTTDQYSTTCFPTVKKFDDISGRIAQNDFSTRPAIQMRFSEVYLMNAEANYMLGNFSAAQQMLNVIRERAAYRTPADGTYIPASQYHVTAANMGTANATNVAAMDLTPAQVAQLQIPIQTAVGSPLCGLDLILDEYTREYYGDLRRWFDLERTNMLLKRVMLYNAEASTYIKPYMIRRPIPQDFINAVLSGPAYPQNTGY